MEADYLCRQEPSLRKDKMQEMLKGDQPRVLVIVNYPVSRMGRKRSSRTEPEWSFVNCLGAA